MNAVGNAAHGRCHPARPLGAIPASVAIVLGWWIVAHSSGQGWVQDLGDLVAAAVVVGLVGPWLALRRIRVEVVACPADGSAGLPVEVAVRTTGPARITPVSPPGRPCTEGPLVCLPDSRGVFTRLSVEVACAAPFGLQWWSRRVELPLARALYVAPRRGAAGRVAVDRPDDGRAAEGAGRHTGNAGDLRAPRPYRPGDALRLVHWPASAHTAELMVRELERPQGPPAVVTVTLPDDPAGAEAEAERAYGRVLALLETGTPVLLTTREEAGTVTATVRRRVDAARRLAAAVSG